MDKFRDNYCGVFADQQEFLECLKRIGKNSFWERRKSKHVRLVALEKGTRMEQELREQYAVKKDSFYRLVRKYENPEENSGI